MIIIGRHRGIGEKSLLVTVPHSNISRDLIQSLVLWMKELILVVF